MGKTSLCVLDQMSLEPFIAEFWRNIWFHMAGHGIATIGYWLMIMPDPIGLEQWMLTSMNKTSSAWIGPHIIRIWWFGRIGPSVSEREATGSCSPKSMATDPLERVQTLVSSMPRRVRALVDPRGGGGLHAILNCRYIGTDIEMISCTINPLMHSVPKKGTSTHI